MKVKEFIEELKKYDPETRVFIPGYEGGVNDLNAIEKSKISLNVEEGGGVLGYHEETKNIMKWDKSVYETCDGIILNFVDDNEDWYE